MEGYPTVEIESGGGFGLLPKESGGDFLGLGHAPSVQKLLSLFQEGFDLGGKKVKG
jgi:hypothetical protein